MSFSIVCNECKSENVIAIATTDFDVVLICQDCDQQE